MHFSSWNSSDLSQIWFSFFCIWKVWCYFGSIFLALSLILIWNSIPFLIYLFILFNEEIMYEFRIPLHSQRTTVTVTIISASSMGELACVMKDSYMCFQIEA